MSLKEFIREFGFNPLKQFAFLPTDAPESVWKFTTYVQGHEIFCEISATEGSYKGYCGTQTIGYYAEGIKKACQDKWAGKFNAGKFIEGGFYPPMVPEHTPQDLLPYEDYMMALPAFPCREGEAGRLFVFFPPEGAEDNELHPHPISDRVITVAQGSGWFICVRDSRLVKYALTVGTRVWMPRGKLHTFLAGPEGMVVESIHNPYVPIDNPQCIFTPSKDKLYYDLSLSEEIKWH